MEKSISRKISVLVVCFLVLQTVFGSFSSMAQTVAAQSSLVITMMSDNQLYEEGDIATSPVTVGVVSTSADSAGVQIEYSLDLGVTWQQYDAQMPLNFLHSGDYFVWFREAGDDGLIERRHIQIEVPVPQAALLMATTPASANVIFVNEASPAASVYQNGRSWATAYSDLQKALTATTAGKEIWVAKGTYKPTSGTDREATFKMKNDVAIYGGFSGGETRREERDVKANETILSGEIGDQTKKTDNSYNVIRNDYTSANRLNNAILDGFTITGGYANKGGSNTTGRQWGGGIYNSYSSAIFKNLVIKDNYALIYGGGFYAINSEVLLTNSKVENNKSTEYGGGVDFGVSNKINIENVIIEGNDSGDGGGISFFKVTNAYLKDVVVKGNTATKNGTVWSNLSTIKWDNGLISGNKASIASAFYIKGRSETVLKNITISGNESTSGSPIDKESLTTGTFKIANSIIVGNNRNQSILTEISFSVRHSLLGDSQSGQFYNSNGIAESPVYAVSDIFKDYQNKNYQLKFGSSAVNTGNNNEVTSQTDLNGNTRIYDGTVDLGAYEMVYGGLFYDGNGQTGGQVPIDSNIYYMNEQATVQGKGTLEKAGYTFAGWNTEINGTGIAYAEAAMLVMGASDVTLYAQWTKNPTYGVTYEGNGATSGTVPTDANAYEVGQQATVQGKGSLEKVGYTFVGWNTELGGTGTPYATDATFAIGTADVKLYAQWTKNPTYGVIYEGNGATSGSVPMDANAYEVGQQAMVQGKGSLEKAGYTFVGWNTELGGTGTAYVAGDTFTMGAADVTLYAQWTKNPTYEVTYEGNGATSGAVPTDANAYEAGWSVTSAKKSGLEKAGYTFTGWNTKADGTGTAYVEGVTFAVGGADVVLYAQWTKNPTYGVTYEGNSATSGAVPTDVNAYEVGQQATVQGKGSLEKAGYTFVGWNTKLEGTGTAYVAGDTFTMGATDVTLYAQWTKNPTYHVTYEGNGATSGTVPMDANAYEVGQQATVQGKGSLEKTGYTFAGWNTEAVGTGTAYAEAAMLTIGAADGTLYAQWTKNPEQIVVAPKPEEDDDSDDRSGNGSGNSSSTQPAKVELRFDTNGGAAMDAYVVARHQRISHLPVPIREGYVFDGWYEQADFSKRWVEGTSLVANKTVYAKWIKVDEEPEEILPTKTPPRFTDIENHWAKDIIEEIAAQNIITGYEDRTFRPNETVSRKHIAVMLQRALDLTAIRQASKFTDVQKDHTYYAAIMALANAGIIDGDNGNYNPDAPMTRAQLAKVFVLAFGLTPGGASTFEDVEESHWSYLYIAALADAGIALGDEGYFRPNEPVTRAQFVAFLYRALNL